MRRIFAVIAALALALATLAGVARTTAPDASAGALAHTCELRVWVNGQPTGPRFAVSPAQYPALCGAEPTATPVPPTATAVPPTHTPHPSPSPVAGGWHAPTTHEHGTAPPAFVLASANQPFTQVRESHVGYKGAYAAMSNGVQSYLITHILSTVGARSHGDHDYQLWIRDPSGAVSYWAGVLDFGTPPPLRTTDTGERPIILSVGDGGCETWYSRPGGLVMDVGWTICGRYENFAGTVLGGVGTFRGMDWVIPVDRLAQFPGAAPSLAQFCLTEFGICRFTFVRGGEQYPDAGVIPIN